MPWIETGDATTCGTSENRLVVGDILGELCGAAAAFSDEKEACPSRSRGSRGLTSSSI